MLGNSAIMSSAIGALPLAVPALPGPNQNPQGGIVSRVPSDDNRLRRFSEIVSTILNSLIVQGFLVQQNPSRWIISATGTALTAADIAALFSPSANQFWASPGPAFRSIVSADLPVFQPQHLANAAAPNDSVYFSTDANKLVYKDSGGIVNNLY